MKKNNLIVAIAFILLTSSGFAQMRKPMRDKVDAMKIGFLTNKLDLTSEEAKLFWPVYNAYADDIEKIRKGRKENIINTRENFDSMSDAEMEKAVDNEIIFRQNEMDVIKKYHPQFKKVLPIKKVAKLYKAEEDFKRRLLEMIKERRNNRMGSPPEEIH